MRLPIVLIFTGICVSFLSGCARNNVQVTFYSDPSGSTLYYGNKNYGFAPRSLWYPISEEDKKQGRTRIATPSARWVSGAVAESVSLDLDLTRGYMWNHTIQRPVGVSGVEKDYQFSLELERTHAMQRQAAAQEAQAAAQQRQAAAQEAQRNKLLVIPTTNCTSRVMGGIVNTSCN